MKTNSYTKILLYSPKILETDPKNLWLRKLGKCTHIAYLIRETDSTAQQNPPDDEHCKVLGGGVEDHTGNEEDPRDEHGWPPAEPSGGVRREESWDQSSEVERRCEQLQALVIVLAVVAVARL